MIRQTERFADPAAKNNETAPRQLSRGAVSFRVTRRVRYNRTMLPYRKSLAELESVAAKFWSVELSEQEAQISVLPLLLRTQESFISLLRVEPLDIERFFEIIKASALPSNLFVKHLVVLADFGGEMLQRISREFGTLFPEGELRYLWRGQPRTYRFRALPAVRLSNQTLRIDGKTLLEQTTLTDIQRDAIALLCFGSGCADSPELAATLARCEIGDYIGKSDELEAFIRERYLWVSRVTGGARSNSLGQLAQQYVAQYLADYFADESPGVTVRAGGRLPFVVHTDAATGRDTAFDLLVSNGAKYVAVEVSFQVTTNSVIERKAGQARARYEQAEKAGHRVAYVLDGAGNFQRETALRTLCAYSHCTVAFTRAELNTLCRFIGETFAEGEG